jgi:hypothetical protein
MRATSIALLALGVSGALGCSAILGIGDLPGGDAGTGSGDAGTSSGASSSGSGTTSGVATSSGASGSGAGASGSGSGGAASGSGSSGGGATSSGGTGDSGANTALAAFLGTWQLTSGEQTLENCTDPNADGAETSPTTIQIVFKPGTTSDLIGTYQGQDSSMCSFAVNLASATELTAVPGQTCAEMGATETDLLELASYSFTITGDASDESAAGMIIDENDTTLTCDLSATATYEKLR